METTSSDPASHECDHCGAPLPPFDETGTRQCSFCKTTYRAPTPKPRPTPTPQAVVFTPAAEFDPVNKASSKGGCGLGGLIILVIIVASIGIPIWAIAGSGGFDLSTPMSFADVSPAVLPGEPSGPASFVSVSYRYDSDRGGSVYTLVKSDGVSSDPVWSTDLDGTASGERTILTDGTSVFVAIERQVTAVSVATGAVTWKATLTDELQFNICVGCFQLHGTSLVALTADGNLQAFDTATGSALWSKLLQDTPDELFDTGPHVVVLDGAPGEYALITLDPATGAEVARFAPACTDPESPSWTTAVSTSSALLASTTPDRLWFLDGSSPACIQQWDVATGAMVSEAITPDESGSLSSPVLVETPLGLVITSYQTLGLVDPSGASYREIVTSADTDLVAVGATPTAIIVNVTNRRGTTSTSVRAIDPNTGATFWDAPMGTAVAVEADVADPDRFQETSINQGGTYVARVDGTAVRILTMREFGDDSQQLILDSLDATTGTAQPSVTVAGESDDIIPNLGAGTWSGSRLITGAGDDQVVVVDFSTMSVPYRFG